MNNRYKISFNYQQQNKQAKKLKIKLKSELLGQLTNNKKHHNLIKKIN